MRNKISRALLCISIALQAIAAIILIISEAMPKTEFNWLFLIAKALSVISIVLLLISMKL